MPILKIATNVTKDQVPKGFLEKANTTFQAAIGKPMNVSSLILLAGCTYKK